MSTITTTDGIRDLPVSAVPTIALDGAPMALAASSDGAPRAAEFSGGRMHCSVMSAARDLLQEAPHASPCRRRDRWLPIGLSCPGPA